MLRQRPASSRGCAPLEAHLVWRQSGTQQAASKCTLLENHSKLHSTSRPINRGNIPGLKKLPPPDFAPLPLPSQGLPQVCFLLFPVLLHKDKTERR